MAGTDHCICQKGNRKRLFLNLRGLRWGGSWGSHALMLSHRKQIKEHFPLKNQINSITFYANHFKKGK